MMNEIFCSDDFFIVPNIFRIKTNEYSFSMKVCFAAPVNVTENLSLLLKLIHIFIVSSNRMFSGKNNKVLGENGRKISDRFFSTLRHFKLVLSSECD